MDGRFFDDRRIAKGYAKDRPFLHTQVIDMVKKECIGSRIFQNGLDVGCGAGLSTRALKALCNEVTGIDISGEMIEEAKTLYTEPGYAFRKGSGEAIPFPDVSVDIISGAGMINWTDRNAFLISAGRVLEKRGILFLYDFWISDRMVENDVYSLWWHDSYRKNFPVASGKKEMPWWSDEDVTSYGFRTVKQTSFYLKWGFTKKEFIRFMMLQSDVNAQTGKEGKTREAIEDWFATTLTPVFQREREFGVFEGYYWLYEKI